MAEDNNQQHRYPGRTDVLASMVVFLVALPLCLGIAVASGVPVALGIVTGVVGGIVVGLLAGAPLQVSGPAAGLTVVCADIVRESGFQGLGAAVAVAGIIQILAGLFRAGKWFRAVSPAVIHGMLAGIGILILSSQLHVLVDEGPKASGVQNLMQLPASLQKGFASLSLPEPEDRQARIDYIALLAQVNARQQLLRNEVSHSYSHSGNSESGHGEERDLHHPVDQFTSEQQGILKVLRESAVRETGRSDSKLAKFQPVEARLGDVEVAMQAAVAALGSGDDHQVLESQEAVRSTLAAAFAATKYHPLALLLGGGAVTIIALWQWIASGSMKLVPGPLLAVVFAIVVSWSLSLPVLYVSVPDNLASGLTLLSTDSFTGASLHSSLVNGFIIAAIASAETLLCATAVDKMHSGKKANYDRELMAQGIGNTICGLLGALPMTGVIVRSASNVQAGGKTRLSAILHGVWLLVFVILLSPLLRKIPLSALAGILVYTGYRLLDLPGLIKLWKEHRAEAVIFLLTVVVIVTEDLLTGVIVGIVASALRLLLSFSRLEISVVEEAPDRTRLTMSGAATFLRLPLLAETLEKIPASTELHVPLGNLNFIDHACLELLTDWAKQHEAAGGSLIMDWDSLHGRFYGDNGNATKHA